MNKLLIAALCLAVFLMGCQKRVPEPIVTTVPTVPTVVPMQEDSLFMTHEAFLAAGQETPVAVETYVQAVQEWWNDTITVYAQSEDGGFFLRNMACSREDAALLVPGARIQVTGVKTQWAGSDQIEYGVFTLLEGSYIAPALDVTALLGRDALTAHQNEKVSFTGLTVEPAGKAGEAFLYGWDGSGKPGGDSDLYFRAAIGDISCLFVVPYYLCGPDSDTYRAVISLKVGDTVNLEGFLYWYDGPQPHITSVTVCNGAAG